MVVFFFYKHSNTLQLQQPKRQQIFVWTSCFCESILTPLQNSSRSVNSCGMGTSGQADRRSCQSLGAAVQWFRVWLWVLLWAVLTSGVEPSQRAVGGAAPGVDLQVQSFVLSLLLWLCLLGGRLESKGVASPLLDLPYKTQR